MAMHNVGAGNTNPLLNRDFGHAPIGNLNGRRVQQVAPEQPRSGLIESIRTGFTNLTARIASAFSSESARTDREIRRGVESSSHHVANMLAALSAGPNGPDGMALEDMLDELPNVTAPVTRHGIAMDDVVTQRVAIHIANMSPAQRADLVEGMAIMEQGSPQAREFAATVRGVLNQYIVDAAPSQVLGALDHAMGRADQIWEIERAMAAHLQAVEADDQDAIQQLSAQIADQQARSYDLLAPAKAAVHQVLSEYGMDRLPPEQHEQLAMAIIRHSMNQMVADGTPNVSLSQMLVLLPNQDVAQLFSIEQSDVLDVAPSELALQSSVLGAVSMRADRMATALHHHAAQLDALEQNAEVRDAYLDKLGNTETLLRGFERFHQRLNMNVDPDVAPVLAALNQRIETARNELINSATAAMDAPLQALQAGDLGDALVLLGQAHETGDTLVTQLGHLGAGLEGADDLMAFREARIQTLLQPLSNQELQALSRQLESPAAQSLSHVLAEAGSNLIANGPDNQHEKTGLILLNRATDLELIRITTAGALAARNLPAPEQAQIPDLPDPATLLTIRQALGVQLSVDNGQIRVDGLPVQQELQNEINAGILKLIDDIKQRLDNGSDNVVPINLQNAHGAQQVYVASTFMADLGRATYIVIDRDNGRGLTVSRSTENDDAQKLQAAQTIFENVANRNPAMLRLLSHLAHQGTLAVLPEILAMHRPDLSPIRTPDGAAGMIPGGHSNTRYYLSPDADGGITLHCEVDQFKPNVMVRLAPNPGEDDAVDGDLPGQYLLDEQNSHQRYSYTIHIDADLNATPTGVATYDVHYTFGQ